jgi:hypothetical protein
VRTETLFVLLYWTVVSAIAHVVFIRLLRMGVGRKWILYGISVVTLGFAIFGFESIVAHYHLHGAVLHWMGRADSGGENRWWYPTLMYACYFGIAISPLIELRRSRMNLFHQATNECREHSAPTDCGDVLGFR